MSFGSVLAEAVRMDSRARNEGVAVSRTLTRRGRWTHVSDPMNGRRWRLNGTTVDLEFDDLHGGGTSLRGAWIIWDGPRSTFEAVDHYLDGAMDWVEKLVDGRTEWRGGRTGCEPDPEWILKARTALAVVSPGTESLQ